MMQTKNYIDFIWRKDAMVEIPEKRKRKISSFIVASDRYKAKYIYCIKLDDWIRYIEYCIEKSVV